MLVRRVVGVIGTGLEEGGDGVDEEEDGKDCIKGHIGLSHLRLLLGVCLLIPALGNVYV